MPFKLSPSSINLMFSCPRCFWLDKHNVWKRPDTPFPQLPNGMDKIIKAHFDRFMEKGELPPELCENQDCNELKLFDNKELLKDWRSNFKGVRWTDEEGNTFFGAVDNILVKGKKLIVLDYKTKGFPIKDMDEASGYYQNQLDIYNLLLRKNKYETEDYAFLLYYIPKEITKTGEFIFDTELVKMDIYTDNALGIFDNALRVLDDECPEKGCEWCKEVKNDSNIQD